MTDDCFTMTACPICHGRIGMSGYTEIIVRLYASTLYAREYRRPCPFCAGGWGY
jgi:hypothetical protein